MTRGAGPPARADFGSRPRPGTPSAATSSAIGPRPTPTTAGTCDQWEQYIRDLAVFGTNAIELIPPALRRRRRQPALPPPADGDDDRDVAAGRRVRPRRLDLVSGDGRGLHRPRDGRVRARRNGTRSSASCRGSTPSSSPAATPATRSPKVLMRPAREADRKSSTATIPRPRCGSRPRASTGRGSTSSWRSSQSEPAWLERRRLRPAGPRRACPSCGRRSRAKYPDPRLPRHHAQPAVPVSRSPTGTSPSPSTEGREAINPRPLRRGGDLPGLRRPTRSASSPTPKAATTTSTSSSGARWAGTRTPTSLDILRQYGRYFIGPRRDADRLRAGAARARTNWQGRCSTNTPVETTLQQFQDMERATRRASCSTGGFSRRSTALLRRLRPQPADLRDRLAGSGDGPPCARRGRPARSGDRAGRGDPGTGVDERRSAEPPARVFELAEALFQSIRMQLSVGAVQGDRRGRGATLDTIDAPR